MKGTRRKRKNKSTHSTPRSDGVCLRLELRVDTERRFLPRFKNRGLAPSNVSKHFKLHMLDSICLPGFRRQAQSGIEES